MENKMSENRGIFYTFRNYETIDELLPAVLKFIGRIALGSFALSILLIVFVID